MFQDCLHRFELQLQGGNGFTICAVRLFLLASHRRREAFLGNLYLTVCASLHGLGSSELFSEAANAVVLHNAKQL